MMLQTRLDEIDGRLSKLMHEFQFLQLNWNQTDEIKKMNEEVWDRVRINISPIMGDIKDSRMGIYNLFNCSPEKKYTKVDDDKRTIIQERIQLLLLGDQYPEDSARVKQLFDVRTDELEPACNQYIKDLSVLVSTLIKTNFTKIFYIPDNECGKQYILWYVYYCLKDTFPKFTNEAYNRLIQNIRVP